MFISKIELTQFKSYQRAELKFPEPAEGKNIVLIGGMNGYGKTSILEALYLCLYGKDALPHLARAGLKTDEYRGYPTFLEKALNGEAKRDGNETIMSVRVVINRTKTRGVEITRRWYFKPNGDWRDEETVVRDVIRDQTGTPRKDGERGFSLNELLEEQYVPAHIAPFFFFDGEEVKKLADQSRVEQVKQGLEGLLGVVLLRGLTERLRTFEDNKRLRLSNFDETQLDALQAKLRDEEGRRDIARASLEKNKGESVKLKAERQSLLERIMAAGGGGGDIASVKDLVEEREQLKGEKRTIETTLSKILADKLPFYLMPSSLLTDFKNQIKSEVSLAKWQADCRALKPKQQNFYHQLLKAENLAFTPELTLAQTQTLERRVEAAWNSLFLPPPPDVADEFVHDYLHEELKDRALTFLNSLNVGREEIFDLMQRRLQLQSRIEEFNRRINRIEGVDRDGTIAQMKTDLLRLVSEIDTLESTNGNLDRELTSLESSIQQTKATYESERKRRDISNPERAMVERSERVRGVIETVIPMLFPLKVRQLSNAMTKVYRQLAHKSQVSKIIIDDAGKTSILSENGKELDFDRSAGENQIFATALIAGLADVSKIEAPLVVDTPLGRLDSKHRENIFAFWTGNSSRQVILLSQDEEIGPSNFKQIKAHVSKTYLLEHSMVGDGIGRTTAKEDKYFKEAP